MLFQLFSKNKTLKLERDYQADLPTVWKAWTDAGMLRKWWGPENTIITDCVVDPKVGGRIYVVMEADEGMGSYKGTRWPMEGSHTKVETNSLLEYSAKSWTEGEEEGTTIDHINRVSFSSIGSVTTVKLRIEMLKIGPKAKMAAFGMKWGYKAFLEKLGKTLEANG